MSSTSGAQSARQTEPRVVEISHEPTIDMPEPRTLTEAWLRMTEAEETLRAIGAGEVDAFAVTETGGRRRVFTLSTADLLYRMFVENMHDGAATVSDSGLILYANDRLAELLSSPRTTVVGSSLSKFVADDGWFELEKVLGRGAAGNLELDLVTSSGTLVSVLVGVSPLEIDGDRLMCLTFTDLSATKMLEEQLRQSNKMESIGSLAGGIAHDFNNLLTVIRGYSAILAPTIDDPLGHAAVMHIDQAAKQAAELTGQLLAFSRQQVLRPEVTDVNAVVGETLTMLDRLLGEDIQLKSLPDPELAAVLVDRSQLVQVILNLAVNAREAMPEGGSLTIQTENYVLDDAYTAMHQGVTSGHYVLLQVTDSGVGMDAETAQRIFDPFFTTKSAGTGLGLSTVYGIVKQSGGHIWIYSEPGIGTTFKVYFPVTDDPIPLLSLPVAVGSTGEGSETILLVEDNELVRVLAAEILESYGYKVLVAANGPEAIVLAALESSETIHLLLTDVVMPEMNGREVADTLTESRPELRVLFTSGYPSDTIVRHGIAEAHTAFIQKPYLPGDLALKIRELLTNPV
jgi:two-component system, cell cycle sensor histidine kinase and response regulator CckA